MFKPEFVGTGSVFLGSWYYVVQNTKDTYYSCKGILKKQNDMTYQRYLDCLQALQKVSDGKHFHDSEVYKAENVGFRVYKQGIVTYKQCKLGLSAYYDKRYVLPDFLFIKNTQYKKQKSTNTRPSPSL